MSNTFRINQRKLTEAEREHIDDVKSIGQALHNVFAEIDNREIRIAKTKLEEAVMWAVKGITG